MEFTPSPQTAALALTAQDVQQSIKQRLYPQALAQAQALLAEQGAHPLPLYHALAAFAATMAGDKDQARQWLDALTALDTLADVETLLAMGSAWFKLGEPLLAIDCLQRAALGDASHALVQARLGAFLISVGQVDAAMPALEFAVQALPASGGASLNLARAHLMCGKPHEALAELERSVGFADKDQELYVFSQAEGLAALGRAAEAEALLRNAMAETGSVKAVEAVVSLVASQGRHEEASTLLREALQKNAESVELLVLAVALAQVRGRLGEAQAWLKKSLALDPDNSNLWGQSAALETQRHALPAARAAAKRALELTEYKPGPERAMALVADASLLAEERQLAMAEQRYREALDCYTGCVAAMNGLGHLLLQVGRVDEASEWFYRLRDFAPVMGWGQLIQLREVPEDPRVLEQIEQLAHRPSLEGPVQTSLLFTVAHAWERKNDCARAWSAVTEANVASRANLPYSPQDHRRRVEREMARFSQEFMATRQGFGSSSPVPVFLLGMPRSGTTLVEQILGSHSQVFGAGELSQISELVQKLNAWEVNLGSGRSYPDCVDDMPASEVRQFAERALDELQALAPDAQRIVDKLPHNFEHIGLIKLLFPNAAILHMQREPRDVAISNYFMNYGAKFGGMGFAYELTWIGEQLVDHQRLMDHWHAVFPGQILEIDYDALVEDAEGWARKIIGHLGLEWEPGVLNFQELDRAVKTASVWQVRQPIYTTSKAKWKRYAEHLGSLEEAMAQVPSAPHPLPLPVLAPGHFFEGMAHLQQGRLVQAEEVFRNLLAERPMHAAAHHFLGAALYAQGRLDEARVAMRESLRTKARYKPWIENLIHCEQALGNQSEVQRLRGLLDPQPRTDNPVADAAPVPAAAMHSGAYPVTSASKGWN